MHETDDVMAVSVSTCPDRNVFLIPDIFMQKRQPRERGYITHFSFIPGTTQVTRVIWQWHMGKRNNFFPCFGTWKLDINNNVTYVLTIRSWWNSKHVQQRTYVVIALFLSHCLLGGPWNSSANWPFTLDMHTRSCDTNIDCRRINFLDFSGKKSSEMKQEL